MLTFFLLHRRQQPLLQNALEIGLDVAKCEGNAQSRMGIDNGGTGFKVLLRSKDFNQHQRFGADREESVEITAVQTKLSHTSKCFRTRTLHDDFGGSREGISWRATFLFHVLNAGLLPIALCKAIPGNRANLRFQYVV